MAVVINEFEVVSESDRAAAAPAPSAAVPTRPDPAELDRELAARRARMIRARAY